MSQNKPGHVNIHGKQYPTVAYRLSEFRKAYPDWSVLTRPLDITENRVVFEASIVDESGRVRSNGHSEEFRAASKINKTSALENAETSAVGRALGNLGIGADETIATAEEVLNAMKQQESMGKTDMASEEYTLMSAMLEDTPEQFLRVYMQSSDERKIEIANCAPQGKKTEWKAQLRAMEQDFHRQMDYLSDQVIECVLEKRVDTLTEIISEIETHEKAPLWSRLTDTEKQFIKENV